MTRSGWWLLLTIIILAFGIRVLPLMQNSLSFHYDMARDAFAAEEIWKNHHFKLQGPPTSTPGLYHGVLYYYLIAIPYLVGQGNPIYPALLIAIINASAIIPLFLLVKSLTNQKKLAYLAAVLFGLSFEAIQYATWISNPAPAICSIAWFFYGLERWRKNQPGGLAIASVAAAFSVQFQFFLVYLFVALVVFGLLFKPKVSNKQIILGLLLSCLILSTFLLTLLKFNTFGQTIQGLSSLSQNAQIDFRPTFSNTIFMLVDRIADVFIYNFIPGNVALGGLLGVTAIFFIKSNRVLLFYLLSGAIIFLFGGHNSNYSSIGMIIPVTIAVTLLIANIWHKNSIWGAAILLAIIASNLSAFLIFQSKGQTLFVIPKDMTLGRELSLIDKTYELAKGQPFSINTLTLPLWTNTTWSYLYHWYGQAKYGYVPSFYGHNQVGLWGNNSLSQIENPLNKSFFIVEPGDGIPVQVFQNELGAEDAKTTIIQEYKFASLHLSQRQPIP